MTYAHLTQAERCQSETSRKANYNPGEIAVLFLEVPEPGRASFVAVGEIHMKTSYFNSLTESVAFVVNSS